MVRLFVGLPVPDETAERLAGLQTGILGARWVPEDNFHLTLRFIGEIDNGLADDVDAELSRITGPAVEIALDGVGLFGKPDAPRMLYAAVPRNEPLVRLQQKVEMAVQRAGCPPEARKFMPHVTLARFRGRRPLGLERRLEELGGFRAQPFTVHQLILFSSRLTAERPYYEMEAAYPLAP